MSYRARGILAALLDKPDGWDVRASAVAEGGTEGRDAIQAALRELAEHGYYRLERRRYAAGNSQQRGGSFAMGTAISETPIESWIADNLEYSGRAVPVDQQADGTFLVRHKDGTFTPDGFTADNDQYIDLTSAAQPVPAGQTGNGFPGPGQPGPGQPVTGPPASGPPAPGQPGSISTKKEKLDRNTDPETTTSSLPPMPMPGADDDPADTTTPPTPPTDLELTGGVVGAVALQPVLQAQPDRPAEVLAGGMTVPQIRELVRVWHESLSKRRPIVKRGRSSPYMALVGMVTDAVKAGYRQEHIRRALIALDKAVPSMQAWEAALEAEWTGQPARSVTSRPVRRAYSDQETWAGTDGGWGASSLPQPTPERTSR